MPTSMPKFALVFVIGLPLLAQSERPEEQVNPLAGNRQAIQQAKLPLEAV